MPDHILIICIICYDKFDLTLYLIRSFSFSRDDPSTLNVAVLLVHESELAKQRRHFELEQQLVNDLKKQLETTHNPVVEAEIVMHEV